MVGFVCNPTSEEEKEELKNQSFEVENNKPNDPFDLSLLELEDFSLPFPDSSIDFDSLRDWIEEESVVPYSMDDLGANPVGVSVEKSDFGVVEKCIEMGSDGFYEKVKVEEECSVKDEGVKVESLGCLMQEKSGFGVVEKCVEMGSDEFCENVKVEEECFVGDEAVKVESLGCFGQEKGGFGDVVEMGTDGVCEKTVVEEGRVGDRCGKLGEIGCSIEKEMEKVSLDGVSNNLVSVGVYSSGTKDGGLVICEGNDVKSGKIENGDLGIVKSDNLVGVAGAVLENAEKIGDIVKVNGDGARKKKVVSDEDESDSESESESESSSSSSSSSESSSDEDEDEQEDEEQDEKSGVLEAKKKVSGNGEVEGEIDMEEGEIMATDADGMIGWSEDEDDEDASGGNSVKGPIRSKNELTVLPPVPPVDVTLLAHHQTLPVGVILSILGAQVIVEGVERHSPLSEGSILWITESKSPLGIVDEIFGPVKNPYYIVRFNSEGEVPAGIQQGTLISFVPEFANHVLNNANLYKKGYDASGENDEELSDEAEFSDDEKEAEYRRMQKMKKRGTNDEKTENKKKDKKKSKNRFEAGKRDQAAGKQVQALANKPPVDQSQHFVQPIATSSHPFPQQGQAPGFSAPPSNMWSNGIPCQQTPSRGLPSGAPMQGMPWLQPNHPQQVYQAPFPNGVPFQQQININPSLPSNLVMLGGQPNFGAGPAFAPWLAGLAQNVPNQTPFGMGIQGQHAQNVPNQSPFGMGIQGQHAHNVPNQSPFGMGMQGQHAPTFTNVGENAVPSYGSQATFSTNSGQNDAFQNFNRGMHRGGGRKSHRRGGGRFGGGRGRHQRS